ncbi:MAG: phage portal protein [Chloroflexi bacterium]|nr:phage portal protein [Chloroflexota bacterium]
MSILRDLTGKLFGSTLSDALTSRDAERMARYRANLDFYNGELYQQHPRTTRQRADEVREVFNYAQRLVEVTASKLVRGMEFRVLPWAEMPEALASAERARDALYDVYETEQLDIADYETAVDAAVLGDGCYTVRWDPRRQRVRVLPVCVEGLWAWWRGDNFRDLYRVVQRYHLAGEEAEYWFGLRAQSAEVEIIEDWTAETTTLYADGAQVSRQPNPYGFLPYTIWPNLKRPKEFWGRADVEIIRPVCQQLNERLSTLMWLMRVSGNPVVLLEGVDSSRGIRVGPGEVWHIPPGARAQVLDLLGPVGEYHLRSIELLLGVLHDLSAVPRAALGQSKAEAWRAMRLELDPLVDMVEVKRLIWGAMVRQRNWMILSVLERMTGAEYGSKRTQVSFGPVLPEDEGEVAAREVALVGAGIHSRRTAALLTGIKDPEAELNRVREET